MADFDHTGPEDNGSRTGRGRGMCGGMCGGRPVNGAARWAGNPVREGMEQVQGMGRCCRHGQGRNNRARNGAMNGQNMSQSMGRDMWQGKGQGMGRGQCMAQNLRPNMQQGKGSGSQADCCGASPAASSDGTDNNS